jgi:hypothetical protein
MSLTHSLKIVTNGLVLCLDAGSKKSYPVTGNVWRDLSGNGNDGTLTNGPTFSSANGGSIVFDGVDDLANTNYLPPTGTNPRTISIWFKPNAVQNKNILGYGKGAPMEMWDILLYEGSVGVHTYGSDNKASTPYEINKWQNIVFTFTAPTITSYMNGAVKNNYSDATINTGSLYTLSLSKGVYGPYYYFNGSISNVKIYDRALTPQEIQQNFNALRGRYGI